MTVGNEHTHSSLSAQTVAQRTSDAVVVLNLLRLFLMRFNPLDRR